MANANATGGADLGALSKLRPLMKSSGTLYISFLGLTGNAVSFWVWFKDWNRSTVIFLFLLLAVSDNVFLFAQIAVVMHGIKKRSDLVITYFWLFGRNVSTHITLMITVNRWVALSKPLDMNRIMSRRRVIIASTCLIVWSMLLAFSQVLWMANKVGGQRTAIVMRYTHIAAGTVAPAILSVGFSVCLLVVTCRYQRRRRQSTACRKDHMTLVVLFIAGTTFLAYPGTFVAVIIKNYLHPAVFKIAAGTGVFMQVLNSSINVVYYYLFSSRFRPLMRTRLCWCFGPQPDLKSEMFRTHQTDMSEFNEQSSMRTAKVSRGKQSISKPSSMRQRKLTDIFKRKPGGTPQGKYVDMPKRKSHGKSVDMSQGKSVDRSHSKTVDISLGKSVDRSHSKIMDIFQGKSVDRSHSKIMDIFQGKSVDRSHSKIMDIFQGKSVDMSHSKIVDISQGKSVDMPYRKTVDISHGKSVDMSHSKTVNISQGQSVDMSHSKNVDISQEKPVDMPHSKTVDISQGKPVDRKGADSLQEKAEDQIVEKPSWGKSEDAAEKIPADTSKGQSESTVETDTTDIESDRNMDDTSSFWDILG